MNYRSDNKHTTPLEKYIETSPDMIKYKLKTRSTEEPLKIGQEGIDFLKGEQLGWFEMGSTIVLVFEAPDDTKFHVSEG